MNKNLNALLGTRSLDLCDIWMNHYPSTSAGHNGTNWVSDPSMTLSLFFEFFFGIDFEKDSFVFPEEFVNSLNPKINSPIIRNKEKIQDIQNKLDNDHIMLVHLENCLLSFLYENLNSKNIFSNEGRKIKKILKNYQNTADLTPIAIFIISLPHEQRKFLYQKIGKIG